MSARGKRGGNLYRQRTAPSPSPQGARKEPAAGTSTETRAESGADTRTASRTVAQGGDASASQTGTGPVASAAAASSPATPEASSASGARASGAAASRPSRAGVVTRPGLATLATRPNAAASSAPIASATSSSPAARADASTSTASPPAQKGAATGSAGTTTPILRSAAPPNPKPWERLSFATRTEAPAVAVIPVAALESELSSLDELSALEDDLHPAASATEGASQRTGYASSFERLPPISRALPELDAWAALEEPPPVRAEDALELNDLLESADDLDPLDLLDEILEGYADAGAFALADVAEAQTDADSLHTDMPALPVEEAPADISASVAERVELGVALMAVLPPDGPMEVVEALADDSTDELGSDLLDDPPEEQLTAETHAWQLEAHAWPLETPTEASLPEPPVLAAPDDAEVEALAPISDPAADSELLAALEALTSESVIDISLVDSSLVDSSLSTTGPEALEQATDARVDGPSLPDHDWEASLLSELQSELDFSQSQQLESSLFQDPSDAVAGAEAGATDAGGTEVAAAETSPAETSPAETSPAETSPAETSPAETSLAEAAPDPVAPSGPSVEVETLALAPPPVLEDAGRWIPLEETLQAMQQAWERHDQAALRDVFRDATRRQPHEGQLYASLGTYLLRGNAPLEARAVLAKGLEQAPTSPEILEVLVDAELALGNLDSARLLQRHLLQRPLLTPLAGPEALDADALGRAIRRAIRLGELGQAEGLLMCAQQLMPAPTWLKPVELELRQRTDRVLLATCQALRRMSARNANFHQDLSRELGAELGHELAETLPKSLLPGQNPPNWSEQAPTPLTPDPLKVDCAVEASLSASRTSFPPGLELFRPILRPPPALTYGEKNAPAPSPHASPHPPTPPPEPHPRANPSAPPGSQAPSASASPPTGQRRP